MLPVNASQAVAVKATAHPLALQRFDRGRANSQRQLTHVALTFRLSPAQQADLDRLLRMQQEPSSPNYHKWLTPDEYAARFGMTAGDLEKVSTWLQSQGLVVDGVSRNRNEIYFSGSVAQIELALKIELHKYLINGEERFANAGDISLPRAFSSVVLGVRGLNDFRPRPRIRRLSPRFTSNVSGYHYLIPGDFGTIYDVNPLYSQGLEGTGQAIAVVGQTAIVLSDVQAFRAASGLPAFDPTLLLVPNTGTSQVVRNDQDEASLDVEWSGGVAKNAGIIYVYVGSDTTKSVFDALQYAVTQNIAPIISISYGNCEANLSSSTVLTMQQWAQEANAQGQTIVGPSGDEGAADCEAATATSATHGLAVDAPASIPEVTGVGGTEFTGDSSVVVSAGCAPADLPYWNGSCNPNSGPTALMYIPEESWNDTVITLGEGLGFAASGGGASAIFSKPSWQAGTGVPADGHRDVPDIAISASGHDAYLICSAGSCTNGFRDSRSNVTPISGTSVGPPIFSGILAIINQAVQSAKGQGNVNPDLYSLAGTSAFHDISSGDNKVPCTTGSPDCPSGTTTIGFNAGTGYDQVTGLGSLDVLNLVTKWPNFSSLPAFSVGVSPLSFTIPSVGLSGSTNVLVSGTNGYNGTINFSCSVPAPSASKISCSAPSAIALSPTNTSGSGSLTVHALSAFASRRRPNSFWTVACVVAPGMFLLVLPSRKRTQWLLGMIVLCLFGSIVSCGSSSSSNGQNQGQATPVTYPVTLTATDSTASHTVTINVTVD